MDEGGVHCVVGWVVSPPVQVAGDFVVILL